MVFHHPRNNATKGTFIAVHFEAIHSPETTWEPMDSPGRKTLRRFSVSALRPRAAGESLRGVLTTKSGGAGLGLVITKTLLEKMGATIPSSNGSREMRFDVLLATEDP